MKRYILSLLLLSSWLVAAPHDTHVRKKDAAGTAFQEVVLADPGADRFLKWNDTTNTVEWDVATASFDSTTVDNTTWSDGLNASNVWTFDVSGTNHTMTFGSGLVTFSNDLEMNGAIQLGDPADTTLSRFGAGDIQVESNRIFRVGGADVPLADGGTGASTQSGAYDVIAGGIETVVASAATTDLGAVLSDKVAITGTTTITSFGVAASGRLREGRFSAALTLTHNAVSLILPGGANITTAAGDRFKALSIGGGNWVVYAYSPASGQPFRVVTVPNGGTGRATGGTAYALIAAGTGALTAQQSLDVGTTSQILVGGGAAALPIWTAATGTGAPVRATSPTLVGTMGIGNGTTGSGILRIDEDDDDGANFASFQVPALAANTVYTLPPDDGDAGEQLQTDGAGVLTWEAAGSGGAGVSGEYGSLIIEGNAVANTFGGASSDFSNATQFLGFIANGISSANITPDHTEDHMVVNATGNYKIAGSLVYSGGTNDVISFGLFINNKATQVGGRITTTNSGAGDKMNGTLTAVASLTAGDTLEIWVQNETDTSSITVDDAVLNIISVVSNTALGTSLSSTTDDITSTGDVDIILGDAAGVNLFEVKDSGGTPQLTVTSDGDLTLTGNFNPASVTTDRLDYNEQASVSNPAATKGTIYLDSDDNTFKAIVADEGNTLQTIVTDVSSTTFTNKTHTGPEFTQVVISGATLAVDFNSGSYFYTADTTDLNPVTVDFTAPSGGQASTVQIWLRNDAVAVSDITWGSGESVTWQGGTPSAQAVSEDWVYTITYVNGTYLGFAAPEGSANITSADIVDGTIAAVDLATAAVTTATHATVATYTVGTTDAKESYGGVIYVTAAAHIVNLPAVAAGMSVTVISEVAGVVDVNPNGTEVINLDGVAAAAGENINSPGAIGDQATFIYRGAGVWHASTNSWVEETP